MKVKIFEQTVAQRRKPQTAPSSWSVYFCENQKKMSILGFEPTQICLTAMHSSIAPSGCVVLKLGEINGKL